MRSPNWWRVDSARCRANPSRKRFALVVGTYCQPGTNSNLPMPQRSIQVLSAKSIARPRAAEVVRGMAAGGWAFHRGRSLPGAPDLPGDPRRRASCGPAPAACRHAGRPGASCARTTAARWLAVARPSRDSRRFGMHCLDTAPRPHLSTGRRLPTARRAWPTHPVHESPITHEKRNAHQCLATGGMPDRDH